MVKYGIITRVECAMLVTNDVGMSGRIRVLIVLATCVDVSDDGTYFRPCGLYAERLHGCLDQEGYMC